MSDLNRKARIRAFARRRGFVIRKCRRKGVPGEGRYMLVNMWYNIKIDVVSRHRDFDATLDDLEAYFALSSALK